MTPSERNTAFFRPLWRRVALVAMLVVWSIVEWIYGDPFWGTLTLGVLGYAVWTFFIAFDKKTPDTGENSR